MILPYHDKEYKVNREVFERVVKDIESGIPLNVTMIGEIFGTPFWQLLILCQCDVKVESGDTSIRIYTGKERE